MISEKERYHTDTKGHEYYETDIKIYATTDYDLFHKLTGNRPVLPERIRKIISSIEEIGWIPVPIVVNEKFEIIDGQGRFESLKALGKPIQFIIVEGIGINECTAMNINSTNWNLNDFINRYAADPKSPNHQSYKKLKTLMETYLAISLRVIGTALKGSFYGGEDIKKNRVYISEEMYKQAIPKLDYVEDVFNGIKTQLPNHTGEKNYLLCAILFCYDLPEIDKQRLKTAIINNINYPDAIWKDVRTAVVFIQRVYNKGLKQQNKIYMESEFLKRCDLNKAQNRKTKKGDK